MELSPAAQEVLRKYKQHLEVPLEVMLDIPLKECEEVYASEREHDAQEHAEWAAAALVEMLRRNDRNAWRELQNADLWAYKMLSRKYLVQQRWLKHSYEKAFELAVKTGRDRRSRCA